MSAAIDGAGRLVVPKAVRAEAGIRPGDLLRIEVVDGRIELVPEPRKVRIVRKGRLTVAVPESPAEPLTASQVRRTAEAIRAERGARR